MEKKKVNNIYEEFNWRVYELRAQRANTRNWEQLM